MGGGGVGWVEVSKYCGCPIGWRLGRKSLGIPHQISRDVSDGFIEDCVPPYFGFILVLAVQVSLVRVPRQYCSHLS